MTSREAVRVAPAGTALVDPQGVVLLHTPSFAGLVGRDGEDLRGAALPDLLEPVLGARVPLADLPSAIDGTSVAGREVTIVAERLPDGRCCLSAADVTGALAAAEALRRARRAAETANRTKARVLATISHELRTPLHAVIGYSDALAQPRPNGATPPGEQVREYAAAIRDAGQMLQRQINNILDVVRLGAGGIELSADVIELPRLVEAAVRQADPAARAAAIGLRAAPDGVRSWLRADERRLRQVLGHLLANALKFTPHGGAVSLETALAEDGDLLLRVRDSGTGIAEAELERVFEPFGDEEDAAATPARPPGVGFGLYFCRAIVEAHGGRLTLESHAGAGTTATLRLPRDRLMPPTLSPRQLQESP